MFQPIREWWQFLLHPHLEKAPVSHPNQHFFTLLVFQCVLSVLSLLVFSFAIPNFEKLANENDVQKLMQESGPIWILLGAALVEELIFRLPLGMYRSRFLIPSGLLIIMLAWPNNTNLWMQISIAFGMGIMVLGILGLHYDYKDLLRNTWNRGFPGVFYLFAVVFALVHLSNYGSTLANINLFQMLLLVVPQFLAGLTFGYARMRMGFLNAVALHAAYNAVFLVPGLLFNSQ